MFTKRPVAISPLNSKRTGGVANTLAAIFSDFAGRNMWAADNSTVVSTTTTWIDYASVHNVLNPAAANQPTTNDPDADFNSKKSATFITDDYLIKNTPNYGAGQTTGSLWFVIKTNGIDGHENFFEVSDAATNNAKLNVINLAGDYPAIVINDGTSTNSIRSTTALSINSKYIIEIESNGSSIAMYVNGVLQTLTATLGSNLGQWFAYANTLSTLDNITIGARINTSPLYFGGKIALVGNYPLLSTANRNSMFTRLNNYYGVY